MDSVHPCHVDYISDPRSFLAPRGSIVQLITLHSANFELFLNVTASNVRLQPSSSSSMKREKFQRYQAHLFDKEQKTQYYYRSDRNRALTLPEKKKSFCVRTRQD